MSTAPLRRSFPVDPASVGGARRWVVHELQLDGRPADDVALLVSELVTNSLLHAGLSPGEDVVVKVGSDGSELRVEVCDEGGRFAKESSSPDRTDGGRGLNIVRALSSDWGVHHDGITLIWFTYRLP